MLSEGLHYLRKRIAFSEKKIKGNKKYLQSPKNINVLYHKGVLFNCSVTESKKDKNYRQNRK